jgi:hypothetical protein
LVKEMVESDYSSAKRDHMVKEAGYYVHKFHE